MIISDIIDSKLQELVIPIKEIENSTKTIEPSYILYMYGDNYLSFMRICYTFLRNEDLYYRGDVISLLIDDKKESKLSTTIEFNREWINNIERDKFFTKEEIKKACSQINELLLTHFGSYTYLFDCLSNLYKNKH